MKPVHSDVVRSFLVTVLLFAVRLGLDTFVDLDSAAPLEE